MGSQADVIHGNGVICFVVVMKHTTYELRQKQAMPLDKKEEMSLRRIEAFTDIFDSYVSISGGKDSEVTQYLVRKVAPNTPLVFVKTGLEYPEVTRQALLHKNVTVLKPEKTVVQIITEFGYPIISKDVSKIIYGARHSADKRQNYLNRLDGLDSNGNYDAFKQQYKKYKFLLDAPFEISNRCCYYMKEKPCLDYERETGLKPILGTMAEESKQRLDGWLKTGCNAFDGDRPMSKPISFWTEQDILRYLVDNHDEMLKALNDESTETGSDKCTGIHPWASVYGDIVPATDTSQISGQVSIFDLTDDYDTRKLQTTGCDRTGCMFCMYGCHCKGDLRFVRLKKSHPEIYDYIMRGGKFNENGMWVPHKGLGFKFVIDWLNEHGNLNILY